MDPEPLRRNLEALRESEELFRQQLEIARERNVAVREMVAYALRAHGAGLFDAAMDLIVSAARSHAAAEAAFGAAVESREAVERLLRDLDNLEGSGRR
jgi:hypothetical protein